MQWAERPILLGRSAYPVRGTEDGAAASVPALLARVLLGFSARMSQQPEPTREEEDAPPKRREEEDAQRYPGHEDPERAVEPDSDAP